MKANKIISSELSLDTLEQLDNSVSAKLTSASFSAKDRVAYWAKIPEFGSSGDNLWDRVEPHK